MKGGRKVKTPPALPGDCRPIPRVRSRVTDGRGGTGRVLETHVVEGLDLDGFGSPVVLVPPDRKDLSERAVWWRLFIQRGDCGHELGTIVGVRDPVPARGASHGLRNFGVVEALGDAGDGQGVGSTKYVFDGERYAAGRTEHR